MLIHNQAQTTYHWTILPGFLIRSTGFPFEWLESLQMPKSHQLCLECLSLDEQTKALQAEFDERLFSSILDEEQQRSAESVIFRHWYKLNHLVLKQQTCPPVLCQQLSERIPEIGDWIDKWNETLATTAASQSAFQQLLADELRQARASLRAKADDPCFQEALFLSNPKMYTSALPSYRRRYDPQQRPAKVKYLERQLYAYLQRLCIKNDTTSFFGPIDYGYINPNVSEPFQLERLLNRMPSRRLTRLAYWAAQTLADLIAADENVQLYLIPRLQDGCALLPAGELHITVKNKRVRLPTRLLSLLQSMDGQRSVSDINRLFGDDKLPVLRSLANKGWLLLRLEIPTTTFDPLGWLQKWVTQLSEECVSRDIWQQRLYQFERRTADFAMAAVANKQNILKQLESDFSELTHQIVRRGEGQIYADRLLVYDEAQGDIVTCTIGRPLQDSLLTRLQPTLDLCASYSLHLQEVCQQRAKAVFMEMGQGNPVPYLAFVHQLDSTVCLADCQADPTVQDFLERLTKCAEARLRDGIIRLEATDLQPFLRPIPPGTLVSPDIFLAAPDISAISQGDYQLIVGEIHYGAQVLCHFLTFCKQRSGLVTALEATLPPPEMGHVRAALVHRRHQGKTFYLELPGLSIEVLGRSLKPSDQIMPVSELKVILDGDRLTLSAYSQKIELYPGDPCSVSNWLFGTPPVVAPPIRLGDHTPRVEIEGTVMARACWHFRTADWLPPHSGNESDLMKHVNRLRLDRGLPEQGFVRLPEERKPFYVDFTNLLSLEFFLTMIRNRMAATFMELLPAKEALWLKGPQGTRSCEWRMTIVYGTTNN